LNEKEFIVFGAPDIKEDEINEVVDSLKSGWIGTGPKVAKFERMFAEFIQNPNVAAVNSCTAALHLSMIAGEIKEGDEVITTPMTFCATVNAIIHSGAKPVLADIDFKTMNINPEEIKKKITSKTKAIIPVHFAGRPCEMKEIVEIAEKYNLKIIEDCAHAVESEYYGKKMGSFGDFGCFSFYVTKNVITGEGGMVIAKNDDLISRIKVLALHGMSKDAWKRFSDEGYKHYQVVEAGFKYNMMDLQAAIGIHQLARVEQNWKRRQEIWKIYNEELINLPITLPADPQPYIKHGYHLYTILIDKKKTGISRDEFLEFMIKEKIGVGVHYLSIPEHIFYQKHYKWNPDSYPNAKIIGRQTVSIPLSPKLSDEQVYRIIDSIKKIIKKK